VSRSDIWCRAAAPADLTAITGLLRGAYPDSQAGDLTSQLPSLTVAVVDEQIAGYGKLRHFTDLPGVPDGYYLGGVVVGPQWRRRGIGTSLSTHRIEAAWTAGADTVYYFANSRNEASISMHVGFGFRELQRPFALPGVTFADGVGVLFGLTRPACTPSLALSASFRPADPSAPASAQPTPQHRLPPSPTLSTGFRPNLDGESPPGGK
jgi:GNAT superfamily N-acetyltransferase